MNVNTSKNFNVTVNYSGASGSSGFTNGNLLSLVSAKYTFNFTKLENSYTGSSKLFGGIRVYTGTSAGSRTKLVAQANYPGNLDYNNTGTLSVTANVKAREYITLCAFPGESLSMGYNVGHTGLLTIM